MEQKQIIKAINFFEHKISKQGNIINERDVLHLNNLKKLLIEINTKTK